MFLTSLFIPLLYARRLPEVLLGVVAGLRGKLDPRRRMQPCRHLRYPEDENARGEKSQTPSTIEINGASFTHPSHPIGARVQHLHSTLDH